MWRKWPGAFGKMGFMDFHGRDGTRLAYRETGAGRPLIVIHGYLGRGAHCALADDGLAFTGFLAQ